MSAVDAGLVHGAGEAPSPRRARRRWRRAGQFYAVPLALVIVTCFNVPLVMLLAARRVEAVVAISTIVFLVGPNLFVVPMSFSSAGGLEFPPPGYSFRWYRSLSSDERWADAVKTS